MKTKRILSWALLSVAALCVCAVVAAPKAKSTPKPQPLAGTVDICMTFATAEARRMSEAFGSIMGLGHPASQFELNQAAQAYMINSTHDYERRKNMAQFTPTPITPAPPPPGTSPTPTPTPVETPVATPTPTP